VRALVPIGLSAVLLLAAPATASADVIFDPADADILAKTLAEATAEQDVCYGWDVQVNDAVAGMSDSVGSDRGAGTPVDTSSCSEYVELTVDITYTSASSESEDYASYSLNSSSGGPTKSDLDELGFDWGGLTGEDPDVVIGTAVLALPLLAADSGMADPIEAAPASDSTSATGSLTDDPTSDWWRNNGTTMLWGLGILLAGGVFAWWVLRSRPPRPERYVVPDTVPDDLAPRPYEPPTAPIAVRPEPPTEPVPVAKPDHTVKPEVPTEPEPLAGESTPDRTAPSEQDVAPSDQKDKE